MKGSCQSFAILSGLSLGVDGILGVTLQIMLMKGERSDVYYVSWLHFNVSYPSLIITLGRAGQA